MTTSSKGPHGKMIDGCRFRAPAVSVGVVLTVMIGFASPAFSQLSLGPAVPIWEDDMLNYGVEVVFNPLHDEFLVLWSTAQGTYTTDINARRISADGSLLSFFNVHSVAGVWLLEPSAAFSPVHDEYLVTWIHYGAEMDVAGRRIGADGAVMHPVFSIAGGSGFQSAPRVSYASSVDEYLVVYQNLWLSGDSDIDAQRVRASDNLLLSWANIATGSDSRFGPTVAYNEASDRYLVAYLHEPTLGADNEIAGKIALTDLNGVSVAPEQIYVPASGSTQAVAAAAGIDGYTLVFSRDFSVRAMSLATDGSPIGPTHGNQISAHTISTDPVFLDIAALWANQYVAAWDTAPTFTSSDIMAARIFVEPGGPVGDEVAVEDRAFEQYWPAVACAPSGRCLVVYSDPWNAGVDLDTDIWGRFVDLPFFADGFEDGGTGAWSLTVP